MGKSKASCILNESLAPQFLEQTADIMKTDFFCLHGSSDTGLEKMNPLTVSLFNININRVDTRFLDMCCIKGQTFGKMATIYQNIDDVLTKLQFPWSNCLVFYLITQMQACVFSILLRPKLFLKKRTVTLWDAHVISYTTLLKKEFNRVTKFDTEDFCIEIYFYLDKITKQKNALQSYAEFCDQEYRTFLEHAELC